MEHSPTIQPAICRNQLFIGSNNDFPSSDYLSKLHSTFDFDQSILPVINGTFSALTSSAPGAQIASTDSFKVGDSPRLQGHIANYHSL